MVSYPSGVADTADDVVGARVAAFVIDHILSIIFAVVVGVGLGGLLQSPNLAFVGVLLGYAVYFVVPEAMVGQTVGKRALGLVVVRRRNGDPISFGQSLIRNTLRLVDGLFSYALGLVVMLVSDDRQRVGDLAAGTVVVRAGR